MIKGPTLLYPNGQSSLASSFKISWIIPDETDELFYEIQFTSNWSKKRSWRTIAKNISKSISCYEVKKMPITRDGGIRIRAYRNSESSLWSTNTYPFSITNSLMRGLNTSSLTILFPKPEDKYDNDIPVAWSGGELPFYIQITSSFSSNSGWMDIPAASNIVDNNFSINIQDFPEGSDYGIMLTSSTTNDTAIIGPLNIKHSGMFITDTTAPTGTISVYGDQTLSQGQNVNLLLNAIDNGTGVKDVRFKDSNSATWGGWDQYSPQKLWIISGEDGDKRIFAQFRDYAGNISTIVNTPASRKIVNGQGYSIGVSALNGKLYTVFSDGTINQYRAISRTVGNVPLPCTAMCDQDGIIYISTYDGVHTKLYEFDGYTTNISSAFSSLSTAQCVSMASFKGSIFLGMSNGQILMYNLVSVEVSITGLPSSVISLSTDGVLLYASIQDNSSYYIFNGASWSKMSV